MQTIEQPQNPPALSRNAMYILLAIGPEERHGYAIMGEVSRLTGGAVRLGPGAIYTTDPELDDQRRRYYRLTAVGRTVAAAEVRRLDSIVRKTGAWALEAG